MSAHGERVTSGTPDDLAAVGDQLARKTEEIRIIQQVSSEINATGIDTLTAAFGTIGS